MAKTKNPIAKVRRHPAGATLAHIDTRNASVVAIGNLRVLITKEDDFWVAQGLEIDYAAYGSTIPEVKDRFESGLAETISAHLRVHRNLEHLISSVSPPEVWQDYIADNHALHRYTFSQVSMFEVQRRLPFKGAAGQLPYANIDYYQQKAS